MAALFLLFYSSMESIALENGRKHAYILRLRKQCTPYPSHRGLLLPSPTLYEISHSFQQRRELIFSFTGNMNRFFRPISGASQSKIRSVRVVIAQKTHFCLTKRVLTDKLQKGGGFSNPRNDAGSFFSQRFAKAYHWERCIFYEMSGLVECLYICIPFLI